MEEIFSAHPIDSRMILGKGPNGRGLFGQGKSINSDKARRDKGTFGIG